MDWLTFIIVIMTVVPLQVLLFVTLYWFRSKFDKYEAVALEIIKRYTRDIPVQYSREEIEFARKHHKAARSKLDINATADEVITAYKKLYTDAARTHRNYIIEGGIRAIAGSLKERYRDEQFVSAVETFNSKLGIELATNWIDDNPLLSAGLDLTSAAWNYLSVHWQ